MYTLVNLLPKNGGGGPRARQRQRPDILERDYIYTGGDPLRLGVTFRRKDSSGGCVPKYTTPIVCWHDLTSQRQNCSGSSETGQQTSHAGRGSPEGYTIVASMIMAECDSGSLFVYLMFWICIQTCMVLTLARVSRLYTRAKVITTPNPPQIVSTDHITCTGSRVFPRGLRIIIDRALARHDSSMLMPTVKNPGKKSLRGPKYSRNMEHTKRYSGESGSPHPIARKRNRTRFSCTSSFQAVHTENTHQDNL
jgi:hypothetical protein